MTSRKLFLTLATIAMSAATTFTAAGPSQAATARPIPTPSPTPSPSPPPHGLNCDDGTNGPGWITGTFYIGAPGVTANTSITVLPDTSDARRYLQLTEQQIVGQSQSGNSTLNLSTAFAQISAQVQNSRTYAQLAQQLQPVTRSTTVDAGGYWACHGLSTGTYLMLATLSETPNQPTASTKRLVFSNTVVYKQDAKNDIWRIDVPISTWREITPVAR